MEYTYHYLSPLGGITLASDGKFLIGLWFDGQKYFGSTLIQNHIEKKLPIFTETICWLDLYFHKKAPNFTPPLSFQSTPFRKAVWELLLTIPFGQTITYKEIAAKIAKQQGISSMSAQAVGGAVGRNPISLIIPCHRVIGTNKNLTGYAGGIDKKIQLLKIEKIDPSNYTIPIKRNNTSEENKYVSCFNKRINL